MLVVLFHARDKESWLFNPLEWFGAGAHGVDIFFVISGFVMYVAARDETIGRFYARRFARIAPLYWLMTVLAVALHCLRTGDGFSRLNLVRSIAFIPFFNPSFQGKIWPLLVPGWTLQFEVFFYVLFGLALLIRRPLLLVWLVLPLLVLLGHLFPMNNALWQVYTSPLLLEFAAGLLVGWAISVFDFSRMALFLPIGIVALLSSDLFLVPHLRYIGVAAVAIVVGALGVEDSGRLPSWRLMKWLGDASFSLYLVHAPIIDLCGIWWRTLGLSGPMQFVSFVLVSVGVSLCAGFATHRWIERPLLRWLNHTTPVLMSR